MKYLLNASIPIAILFLSMSCQKTNKINEDYLLIFTDTTSYTAGYKNTSGDIIIPAGKYEMCLTDTFKTYAIVVNSVGSFVAIDRNEKELYGVYVYDNGPDYPSEGLFRITNGTKIGFADFVTGEVIIQPQFECANPFENGISKVSNECRAEQDGEYYVWVSDDWSYIDKKGNKVTKPAVE